MAAAEQADKALVLSAEQALILWVAPVEEALAEAAAQVARWAV